MKLPVLNGQPPALGTFSKAIGDSVQLSFGQSGGENCWRGCPHHPDSTAANPTRGCYAARAEVRPDRAGLHAKLARHEAEDPAQLCRRAAAELQRMIDRGRIIPWLRISAFGSVPNSPTAEFIAALRDLLQLARAHDIPVHLPVEGKRKADLYRAAVGDLCAVRMSAVSARSAAAAAGQPLSITAGQAGQPLRSRIIDAKRTARQLQSRSGRRAVVCPAVAAAFNRKLGAAAAPKAKCGSCTACADPAVDIVYPLH